MNTKFKGFHGSIPIFLPSCFIGVANPAKNPDFVAEPSPISGQGSPTRPDSGFGWLLLMAGSATRQMR
jgi:hypothetical protein